MEAPGRQNNTAWMFAMKDDEDLKWCLSDVDVRVGVQPQMPISHHANSIPHERLPSVRLSSVAVGAGKAPKSQQFEIINNL
jgi:hypothetical protein